MSEHLTIESLSDEDRLVWIMTYSAAIATWVGYEHAGILAWDAVRLRDVAEPCGAPPRPERKAPDPEEGEG